jgi:hypothetical protein
VRHLFRAVVVMSLPVIALGSQSRIEGRRADDEGPIRVTGGSLKVSLDTNDGALQSTNSSGPKTDYKHEPQNGKVHKGDLYVLVLFAGTSTAPYANYCYSTTKLARVAVYHADRFNVSFGVDVDPAGTKRTTVHASSPFDGVQPTQLTHNAVGKELERVETSTPAGKPATWGCKGDPGSIKEVRICSSDTKRDCKVGK